MAATLGRHGLGLASRALVRGVAARSASSGSASAWVQYRDLSRAGKGTVPAPETDAPSIQDVVAAYNPENIGNTRLVEMEGLTSNPLVKIFLKMEYENPGGSIKDRIALHIIDSAEKSGDLTPGGTVVAASSGNTGAAVSLLARARGYTPKIITNEKCSQEKVDALKGYGAELIVGPSGVPADHPDHYQNIELRLCEENANYFGVNQYDNLLNPEAYTLSLGPEIMEQTDGQVTHFFAGASTGGTISGTGGYLKNAKPGGVTVVCPDPVGSIFWEFYVNGNVIEPVSFQVEGVGKDSIPGAMSFSVIDDMPQYHDRDIFAMCRFVYETSGLCIGGSSGLNLCAAAELADRATEPGTYVCVAPDRGEKYLSKIFNEDWLRSKNLI
mmetsp:Transcript_30908/g.89791  ORF Transcript_30908/g.89791 Transcript_30908/m.89791 type:complete len:384 (-) Transcript_30908:409-1560(-)